jgi:hypothetical protein
MRFEVELVGGMDQYQSGERAKMGQSHLHFGILKKQRIGEESKKARNALFEDDNFEDGILRMEF